ncbi:MAG: efflux RND transporter periplasmic adaptor subunit [Pirellulales bacterium]|nr:efflux RND transporter periplasmic adaptor subunit [Pirellulales bacterium]
MRAIKRAGIVLVGVILIAVFGIWASGAFVVPDHGDANAKISGPDGNAAPLPVIVTPARSMRFENSVHVSGNIQAKNYAFVSARMPGPLDAVFVDEGDSVQAGETRLFQSDSVKLSKAVAVARQGLTVAECTVREKEASLEQAIAQSEQAATDLKRYQELAKKNAISAQMVEQQDSLVKQSNAMLKHKEALITLANAQLEQAKLSLMMAEKDLADSLVLAPISGQVSERMKEPGEMAAPGTPIIKIEDPTVLEISVHIPEEFYAQVQPGTTWMRVHVGAMDLGKFPVTYKSPTVHSKLRTFEVQGIIKSPPPEVVPGCLTKVSIILDERDGIGVPTSVILKRGGKDVLFCVADGKAEMIEVETGLQSEGWTEVNATALAPGIPMISMGQTQVDDGTAVTLVEEAAR